MKVNRAYKERDTNNKMSQVFACRLSAQEAARVEELVAQSAHSKAQVLRLAILKGLDLLQEEIEKTEP